MGINPYFYEIGKLRKLKHRGFQVCNVGEVCMGNKVPEGYLALSEMIVWKSVLKPIIFATTFGLAVQPIVALILFPVMGSWKYSLVLPFLVSIVLIIGALAEVRKMKELPLVVNSHHPWSGVESTDGRAEVMLWTPEKKWFNVYDVSIRATKDTLSSNWMMVANDSQSTMYGEIIGVSKKKLNWFIQMVNISISQARLANGDVKEDSFADAREREELESGLLDREWEKTTPGILSQENVLDGGLRQALRKRNEIRTVKTVEVNDSEE